MNRKLVFTIECIKEDRQYSFTCPVGDNFKNIFEALQAIADDLNVYQQEIADTLKKKEEESQDSNEQVVEPELVG